MTATPKTDKEAMWAVSGTGDDFQCIHVDEARKMELLLIESRRILDDWCEEYGHGELEIVRDKVDAYFAS